MNNWKRIVRSTVAAGALISVAATACSAQEENAQEMASVEWGRGILEITPEWYGTTQAQSIADNVLKYQSAEGGWPKNVDLDQWPPREAHAQFATDGKANTFDNDATSTPMEFLARVYTQTEEAAYRDAFMRGFEYTLEAQYENGGWPQFYPLRDGYYSNVTFNDDAMVRIMTLLGEIAAGEAPYAFMSEADRERAAAANERGLETILKTQIRQNGNLTVWCAQYDVDALQPAWARAYEPPSLSGNESVGILRYLMSLDDPSPDVVAAVEGGVQWLRENAISGLRYEEFEGANGELDRRVVPDENAGPIWARFYELVTNRPLFLGRNSVYRYALDEIEQERRAGYGYYGTWAKDLLETDYPAWKAALDN